MLEIKSTFLHSSQFDAWLHKTQTLRKSLELASEQEFVSLYENGISGRDFVNAIEQEAVWKVTS